MQGHVHWNIDQVVHIWSKREDAEAQKLLVDRLCAQSGGATAKQIIISTLSQTSQIDCFFSLSAGGFFLLLPSHKR